MNSSSAINRNQLQLQWINRFTVNSPEVYGIHTDTDTAAGLIYATGKNCLIVINENDTGKLINTFNNINCGFARGLSTESHTNRIYIADYSCNNIKVLNNDGIVINQIGSNGLSYPTDVCIDSSRSLLFAVDHVNSRIMVYSTIDGAFTFIRQIGSNNNQINQSGTFIRPYSVCVVDDQLYVSDAALHRISVFKINTGEFILQWGIEGTDPGQFRNPNGIHSDNRYIYVCDQCNRRIQVFTLDGRYVSQWINPNQSAPCDITISSAGLIYIVDGTRYIDVLQWKPIDSANTAIEWISTLHSPRAYTHIYADHRIRLIYATCNSSINGHMKCVDVYNYDTGETVNRTFKSNDGSANGIFVSVDGLIYIAESERNHIEVFDSKGNLFQTIGQTGELNSPTDISIHNGEIFVPNYGSCCIVVYSTAGKFLRQFGSAGTGNGEFGSTGGLSIDPLTDLVYVSDTRNRRIQVFRTADGQFVRNWTHQDAVLRDPIFPMGIAIGANSLVYIADYAHHRISVFNNDGNLVNQFGEYGNGNGQFTGPRGLSIADNQLYVVDDSKRIQIFKLQ